MLHHRPVSILFACITLCWAASSPARAQALLSVHEHLYCGPQTQREDSAPRATKRKQPKYPDGAGKDGYALARVTVDGAGDVTSTEILLESEPRGFATALSVALPKWKFEKGRPGTMCLGVAFLRGGHRSNDENPINTVRQAPDPIETDYKPAYALEANTQVCDSDVTVLIGAAGVPIATKSFAQRRGDATCAFMAADIVWHWRFPPETPAGFYLTGILIERNPSAAP